MTDLHVYKTLARRLDELPNGFPPAEDGSHLRLLARLFTPEEAALAASLSDRLEPAEAIAQRNGADPAAIRRRLKAMARKGLISAGRADHKMGYARMPFVVGIYEMQAEQLDAELAKLFEDYFQTAFRRALAVQPPFQRVIPIGERIQSDPAVAPHETAAGIVARASAWAVTDCICRKQTALIGRPCPHPIDVCMILSDTPGAFRGRSGIKELTRDGALEVLRTCAEAGLVHCVSNTRDGTWYICNCCTCSCGILRGMAEGGMASVVAHSGFICTVEEAACSGCGACEDACVFKAIHVNGTAHVDGIRCAGCGVCVAACPEKALSLARQSEDRVPILPTDDAEWRRQRAAWREKNT